MIKEYVADASASIATAKIKSAAADLKEAINSSLPDGRENVIELLASVKKLVDLSIWHAKDHGLELFDIAAKLNIHPNEVLNTLVRGERTRRQSEESNDSQDG